MVDRPKRRRKMDNPYNLKIINNSYYIIFKSNNKYNEVKVTKEIFDLMDRFELDDLKELNEFDRHITHFDLSENAIYGKRTNKDDSIEDLIIRETSFLNLRNAVNTLPDKQKNRIKKYYFYEMKLKDIAKEENVSTQIVSKSIKQGIEKLKQILKK